MMTSKWRYIANQVIARVARENPDATPDEMRKLLHDAYPFGMRQYHPYKIWLSAVKQYFAGPKAIGEPVKQSVTDLGTSNLPLFAEGGMMTQTGRR